MLIASDGISRVVARLRYHAGGDTPEILASTGIELKIVEDVVETYDGQRDEGALVTASRTRTPPAGFLANGTAQMLVDRALDSTANLLITEQHRARRRRRERRGRE